MGVMGCHRKECNNIMCDTYVRGVGYVCYDCQKEFKIYLGRTELNPTTELEIKKELNKFMSISKGEDGGGEKMDVDEFFSINTKR